MGTRRYYGVFEYTILLWVYSSILPTLATGYLTCLAILLDWSSRVVRPVVLTLGSPGGTNVGIKIQHAFGMYNFSSFSKLFI